MAWFISTSYKDIQNLALWNTEKGAKPHHFINLSPNSEHIPQSLL